MTFTFFLCTQHGTYTFLLNVMLEANQPVLLAGEPGSGKTTLCKGFLRFNRPYINLPASPLLSSRELLTILQNIVYQKLYNSTGSRRKVPRLLLFLDDLHEAPSGKNFFRIIQHFALGSFIKLIFFSVGRRTWEDIGCSGDTTTEHFKRTHYIV